MWGNSCRQIYHMASKISIFILLEKPRERLCLSSATYLVSPIAGSCETQRGKQCRLSQASSMENVDMHKENVVSSNIICVESKHLDMSTATKQSNIPINQTTKQSNKRYCIQLVDYGAYMWLHFHPPSYDYQPGISMLQ